MRHFFHYNSVIQIKFPLEFPDCFSVCYERKKMKKEEVAYYFFMIGGLLLSIPLAILAIISELPVSATEWTERHKTLLIIADECFPFAIVLLGIATLLIASKKWRAFPVSSALAIFTLFMASVGWINIALDLGRLVYPVNNLGVFREYADLYVSQVYGNLHWAALALGVGTIALGFISERRNIFIFSIMIGVLQVIGTYYGFHPPIWLPLLATAGWLLWAFIFSLHQLKLLTYSKA